jgi:AcrR family transcriptional regulator
MAAVPTQRRAAPSRPRRQPPERRPRRRRPVEADRSTRDAIFAAAAEAFSARGFDGVGVDDIARRARVNKAMLYYHFRGKLGLYREVVRDMLRAVGAEAAAIAGAGMPPLVKVERFVDAFMGLAQARPWMPTLMLREIVEGAPRLDLETLGLMRTVYGSFARILAEGQAAGDFRQVHPVLAYLSVIGPLLLNAARERAGAEPGRANLPMFVRITRSELNSHLQGAALRMLAKD